MKSRSPANPFRIAACVAVVSAASAAAAACGASRASGQTETTPPPPAANADASTAPDTTPALPTGSMEERLLAGDYAGVVAAYWADSTLHDDETAMFRAGLASAMPGHRAHDRRRAIALFTDLIGLYPGSEFRPSVALYLRLMEQENDLRATIDRQDRELKQLKAIDLGVQPPEDQP